VLLVILSMSFFTISITFETVSVNAESPIAKLSLECGILRDHRIDFTVNGFTPNGNVHWEFVDSNGNIMHMAILKLMNLVDFMNILSRRKLHLILI
jgi:hypothetical protein